MPLLPLYPQLYTPTGQYQCKLSPARTRDQMSDTTLKLLASLNTEVVVLVSFATPLSGDHATPGGIAPPPLRLRYSPMFYAGELALTSDPNPINLEVFVNSELRESITVCVHYLNNSTHTFITPYTLLFTQIL